MNLAKARRPIAVVDERTYRHAVEAVTQLLDTGEDYDLVHAESVATAAILWLRYEVRTGRRSKRADRAARLEQWELSKAEIHAMAARAYGLDEDVA